MGLYRWLLLKVAGWAGLLELRRYKVTLFGESLGVFKMPRGHHMANPGAYVRPVLTKPFKTYSDHFYIYWVEPNPEGGFTMVSWSAETPDEVNEASRFYNTAHGRNPDGSSNPDAIRPLPARLADEVRLIRAALANPDAEQPYRDYAAWLTARGDPMGDYIRLTLDIEKLPEEDRQRERLETRRQKLVERHGAKWVRPLTDLGLFPGVLWAHCDCFYPDMWYGKKGVIEELDVPSDTEVFHGNPAQLFHGAPFLRKLSINDSGVTMAAIGTIQQMGQIESLSLLLGTATDDDVRSFANSPNLGRLRELKLTCQGVTPTGAQYLTQAPWLTGLRVFDLNSNTIGDAGAEWFASSPSTANLTEFHLRGNQLTDCGLRALCASPHLARLEVLDLESNAFTAVGMCALTNATFAGALKSLSLSGCGIDAEAARALAGGTFPALRSLNISSSDVRDGLQAIAAAPFFRNLEVFSAGYCDAGDVSAQAIANAGFTELRELELHSNQFTDAGVTALVRSKAVTKLRKLNLSRNPFGLEGVLALAEADLPALEELDLQEVRCGPAGATALAKSRHFKNLKRLWVSKDIVGVNGQAELERRFTEQVVGCY